MALNNSIMEDQLKIPPPHILRAYAHLIDRSFLYFRSNSYATDERAQEKAHDLADAMHNIGAIMANYGTWTDDERYREIYLRPFDRKWGDERFRLEGVLDDFLASDSDSD